MKPKTKLIIASALFLISLSILFIPVVKSTLVTGTSNTIQITTKEICDMELTQSITSKMCNRNTPTYAIINCTIGKDCPLFETNSKNGVIKIYNAPNITIIKPPVGGVE